MKLGSFIKNKAWDFIKNEAWKRRLRQVSEGGSLGQDSTVHVGLPSEPNWLKNVAEALLRYHVAGVAPLTKHGRA